MSTAPEWSPDEFAAKLADRRRARQSTPFELAEERTAYRRAAALLTSFDPTTLRLPGSPAVGGAVLQLVDDCVSKGAGAAPRWTLRPDVRTLALRSFDGPDDARLALEANLDSLPEHGPERLALAYLRGTRPDFEGMDITGLVHLDEALCWLRQVPGVRGLPQEHDVRALLERRRLLEPLNALMRHRFEGRTAELDRLRDYIGALPAATWRSKIAGAGRAVQQHFSDERDDLPLVVHGPGGIGKSTLVVRSLLDHVTARTGRFPFVYVDFERATVWVDEPLTLMAEMSRQLGVQYPEQAGAFGRLAAASRYTARQQRARREELEELKEVATARVALGRAAERDFHATARQEDARTARELGSVLRTAVSGTRDEPPFVIVLDSFEEAQYRASPVLDRVWAMFDALTAAYPRTRVIVAGRRPVGHPNVPVEAVPTLALGELDLQAAEQVLRSRGVSEPVARALVQRIGGNPLSLQLAADVAVRIADGDGTGTWVDTVPARRRRLFGAVDDMLIQGVLYDRLLHHVTNADVRAMAHPGLVLRRITPQLIQVVLAPVSGVDVGSADHAHELFELMARELDLVERVAPDVLAHRPDVRRAMLRLMEDDKPDAVRAVERRAVEFYSRSSRPADRAEELYHRLRLGDPAREIRDRWTPEAAAHLGDVDEELPARGARLLARLRQGGADARFGEEEQIEWEQRTAVEVEHLLMQDFVDEALALLAARRPWTMCSPLHSLRVQALLRCGDLAGARVAVNESLDASGVELCGDAYLELLLQSAQVAAASGDVETAHSDLLTAERTANRLGRDLDALGALLQRSQLPGAPPEVDADLACRVEALPDAVLAGRAALFRAVAAEVGERQPRVLAHALDLVGLPVASRGALQGLARAITTALAGQPAVAEALGRVAKSAPEQWAHASPESVYDLLRSLAESGRLDGLARELLTIRDDSGTLRAAVAAAMSEGAHHA